MFAEQPAEAKGCLGSLGVCWRLYGPTIAVRLGKGIPAAPRDHYPGHRRDAKTEGVWSEPAQLGGRCCSGRWRGGALSCGVRHP